MRDERECIVKAVTDAIECVAEMRQDGYLTLNELSLYAGLSRRTLERYIADPVTPLPAFKLGVPGTPGRSSVRVRRSDFDKWMEQYRVVGGVSEAEFERLWRKVNAPARPTTKAGTRTDR